MALGAQAFQIQHSGHIITKLVVRADLPRTMKERPEALDLIPADGDLLVSHTRKN
jgi:hypothetical protein